MVPHHPAPLGRPAAGLSGQPAAVGPDEEVGAGEQVEGVAQPLGRPAVVEQRQPGQHGPAVDAEAARPPGIVHRLHQPGGRHPGLADVAVAERQGGADRALAVFAFHGRHRAYAPGSTFRGRELFALRRGQSG